MLAPMAGSELRDETVDLLSRLIQVDTTNPPGNETAAAELLRDYLEASGSSCSTGRRSTRRPWPRR
jgi:acetylornithine deacetylase/succinyl-diaminopimelate desuccinylase-like protein